MYRLQNQDQFVSPLNVDLGRYLWNRREDVFACRAAFSSEDYSSIAKIGKRMKLSGNTSGFPEVTRWGKALESAAQSKNEQSIEGVIIELSKWILRCGSCLHRNT